MNIYPLEIFLYYILALPYIITPHLFINSIICHYHYHSYLSTIIIIMINNPLSTIVHYYPLLSTIIYYYPIIYLYH